MSKGHGRSARLAVAEQYELRVSGCMYAGTLNAMACTSYIRSVYVPLREMSEGVCEASFKPKT